MYWLSVCPNGNESCFGPVVETFLIQAGKIAVTKHQRTAGAHLQTGPSTIDRDQQSVILCWTKLEWEAAYYIYSWLDTFRDNIF